MLKRESIKSFRMALKIAAVLSLSLGFATSLAQVPQSAVISTPSGVYQYRGDATSTAVVPKNADW